MAEGRWDVHYLAAVFLHQLISDLAKARSRGTAPRYPRAQEYESSVLGVRVRSVIGSGLTRAATWCSSTRTWSVQAVEQAIRRLRRVGTRWNTTRVGKPSFPGTRPSTLKKAMPRAVLQVCCVLFVGATVRNNEIVLNLREFNIKKNLGGHAPRPP